MRYRVGDRLLFLGYQHLLPEMEPIFFNGDVIVVAAVMDDEELRCFPIDGWGRVYSLQGDTVFADEVVRLPLPRVPQNRLPCPYCAGDLIEIDERVLHL